MAETGEAAAAAGGGRSVLAWKAIALALLLFAVLGGGAAGYLFFFGQPKPAARTAAAEYAEAPPPFYLEVKPFVVSMLMAGDDNPHFVQLGVNLTLSGSSAGKLVEAYLPEVEDAMRQTALTFKVGDVTTPAGIDQLRAAITRNVNRLLLERLGPTRIARDSGGSKDLVRNVYFSTLVVE